jgi:hypothetical protein
MFISKLLITSLLVLAITQLAVGGKRRCNVVKKYQPVCGYDGKTYANRKMAKCAKQVSIKYKIKNNK